MQRHCGRVPDFGDKNGMIPYVFGCQIVRLRDETERRDHQVPALIMGGGIGVP
jgi:hypothetical protein